MKIMPFNRQLRYGQVVDYHTRWQSACRELEVQYDFVHYIELFGVTKAERLYKQHVARLRDEFIAQQQSLHLHRLDAILHKLLPDLAAVADRLVW